MPLFETEEPPSPLFHSRNIRRALTELIEHIDQDYDLVDEPRFRALLRESAARLQEIRNDFRHYDSEVDQSAHRPPAA